MKHFRTILISCFLLAGLALQGQIINESITVQQTDSLIKARFLSADFVVLDIRTEMEFTAGHLENAVQVNFLKRRGKREMWKLDRNKAYLIYCRSGKRSKSALDMMKDKKFKEVYNMLGGIKDWNKEDYPVVKEDVIDGEFKQGKKIKK